MGVCYEMMGMRVCTCTSESRSKIYPTSSTEICRCSLTHSSQANRTSCNQSTCRTIEWQVDREEDVATVAVEVHREVDPVGRRLLGLNPAHLRGSKTDSLTVVEHKLVLSPRRALEHETWEND